MRWLIAVVLVGVLSVPASAESLTEDFCLQARSEAARLQADLPIHKDEGTVWIGVTASLLEGTCHVRHEYLVRSEVVAHMVVQSRDDVTVEMVDGWLATDEARDKIQETLRKKLRQDMVEMLVVPDVVFIARVQTSGALQPFNVQIRTGEAL